MPCRLRKSLMVGVLVACGSVHAAASEPVRFLFQVDEQTTGALTRAQAMRQNMLTPNEVTVAVRSAQLLLKQCTPATSVEQRHRTAWRAVRQLLPIVAHPAHETVELWSLVGLAATFLDAPELKAEVVLAIQRLRPNWAQDQQLVDLFAALSGGDLGPYLKTTRVPPAGAEVGSSDWWWRLGMLASCSSKGLSTQAGFVEVVAHALAELGRIDEALAMSQSDGVRCVCALSFARQGKVDRVRQMVTAITRSGNKVMTLVECGKILAMDGHSDAAQSMFREAEVIASAMTATAPASETAGWDSDPSFLVGNIVDAQLESGFVADATEVAEQPHWRASPANAVLLLSSVALKVNHDGDAQEASRLFDAAKSIAQSRAQDNAAVASLCLAKVAVFQQQAGDNVGAAATFESAEKVAAGQPAAQFFLALAYAEMQMARGDAAGSIESFRHVGSNLARDVPDLALHQLSAAQARAGDWEGVVGTELRRGEKADLEKAVEHFASIGDFTRARDAASRTRRDPEKYQTLRVAIAMAHARNRNSGEVTLYLQNTSVAAKSPVLRRLGYEHAQAGDRAAIVADLMASDGPDAFVFICLGAAGSHGEYFWHR